LLGGAIVVAETLTPAQQRTLRAREALARKFSSVEEKSQYYRAMAAKANAGRLVLSAAEVATLEDFSDFLREIAARSRPPQPAHEEAAHAVA
jgi:hypothetical protein